MKNSVVTALVAVAATVAVMLVLNAPQHVLVAVSPWVIYAALPPANLFPVLYGILSPWWRSLIGRALMTKAVGLAVLFDLSAIHHATDWKVPLDVATCVVGLVVVGIWFQFLAYLVTRFRR